MTDLIETPPAEADAISDAPLPACPAGLSMPGIAGRDEVLRRQQVRLQSTLVLLMMAGLVMALPFILTMGAVVVQPPVTALILSIVLSPLADRLTRIGLPNMLASLLAIIVMLGVIVVALTVILQPAFDMVDQVPAMAREIARRFAQLRENFAWVNEFNRQITRLTGPLNITMGGAQPRVVALAGPSVIEQLALATPSVLLEAMLTILMTFFMIESRIRMRRRLLSERANFSSSVRIARVMRDVQDRVASYILTVAQINLGVGLIVYAGAQYYGFSAPVMWGGLAFVLNFVPYMGPLAMVSMLALVGMGTASTVGLGLIPAASFLALHAVEANLVTPSILGARFTLNPVSILISFSFFTLVWGVLGALLSVPILLTLSALVDHLGRPNLVGFLFGESLFEPGRLGELPEETPDQAAP